MPFVTAIFPSTPYGKNRAEETEGGLIRQLCKASEFLRSLRVHLRYGELTRAPLHLLRLQMEGNVVECEWLARAPDPWDEDLSHKLQRRHASLQALRDTIDVRDLLFDVMPQISVAQLKVYRKSSESERELIIEGLSHRSDRASRGLHSLAMRAKVLGFNFHLEGDALRGISSCTPFLADSAVAVGA